MHRLKAILLIEDNPDDIELTLYAFRKTGIENPLHVVSDGEDAVAYILGQGDYEDRSKHPYPSLVLLDLKLPKVSGFQVLKTIRSHGPTRHTPVVVLTSSNQDADIERAYSDGANSYLVKPVRRDGLLHMAKALNAYWIELNESVAPGGDR